MTKTNIYFAGRLILAHNANIRLDRLGSVRNWSRYYPFGEEQGSGTTSEKFATYYRDTSTSLDYAINRYYGSTMGRFTTPDPYGGSATLTRPNSWDRYAYVENDPVNNNDPLGLYLARVYEGVNKEAGGTSFGTFVPAMGDEDGFYLGAVSDNRLFSGMGTPSTGGGAGPSLSDLVLKRISKNVEWLQNFKPSKECEQLFTDIGTSFAAVAKSLKATVFYNGLSGTMASSIHGTWKNDWGIETRGSVVDFFAKNTNARALTLPGTGIFVGSLNWWDQQTDSPVNGTIMHEGIHTIVKDGKNISDGYIQDKWNLTGNGSANISGRISDVCFPTRR